MRLSQTLQWDKVPLACPSLPETALPRSLANAAVPANSPVRPATWLWSQDTARSFTRPSVSHRPASGRTKGQGETGRSCHTPTHGQAAGMHMPLPWRPRPWSVSCPQCSRTGKSPSPSSPPGRQAPVHGPRALPATGGQAASGRGCAPDGRWEGLVSNHLLPLFPMWVPHCGLPWLRRDWRTLGPDGRRLQPTCGTFLMAPGLWALSAPRPPQGSAFR